MCDFEGTVCDWTQLVTDELDWQAVQGMTRTPWTGPARDHTTGLSTGESLTALLPSSSVSLGHSRQELITFIVVLALTQLCLTQSLIICNLLSAGFFV